MVALQASNHPSIIRTVRTTTPLIGSLVCSATINSSITCIKQDGERRVPRKLVILTYYSPTLPRKSLQRPGSQHRPSPRGKSAAISAPPVREAVKPLPSEGGQKVTRWAHHLGRVLPHSSSSPSSKGSPSKQRRRYNLYLHTMSSESWISCEKRDC